MGHFELGAEYNRKALHANARASGQPGNRMAGITIVAGQLCIFWNPYKKLYMNAWIEEPSEFWYSGEGQSGSMRDTAGNRHLRDAEASGTPIEVFYKIARTESRWLNLGSFRVVATESGVSQDQSGNLRTDLRFRLLADFDVAAEVDLPHVSPSPAPELPGEELLWSAQEQEAAAQGPRRPRAPQNQRAKRQSSALKSAYVRRRAIDFGGTCECCGEPSGWLRDDGLPHFQAHHLIADLDLVDWIAAVCGTCHDRLHYGQDRAERSRATREHIVSRHEQLGRPTYSELEEWLHEAVADAAGSVVRQVTPHDGTD
jgi:5-methylcytosine-specific restriction protein A